MTALPDVYTPEQIAEHFGWSPRQPYQPLYAGIEHEPRGQLLG